MRFSEIVIYSRFPVTKLIYFCEEFASRHFIVPRATKREQDTIGKTDTQICILAGEP